MLPDTLWFLKTESIRLKLKVYTCVCVHGCKCSHVHAHVYACVCTQHTHILSFHGILGDGKCYSVKHCGNLISTTLITITLECKFKD